MCARVFGSNVLEKELGFKRDRLRRKETKDSVSYFEDLSKQTQVTEVRGGEWNRVP